MRIVTVVNLLTGEEVAAYPSLIPVIDLAVPLVQVFNEGGEWVGYVVVYNPSSGELEYYRVSPGSLDLPETDPVTVSPDLKYAVRLGEGGATIILRDGKSWSLGRDVRPAPPSIYMGVEPSNAIVDIDDNGVLMRVTDGSETSIIYRSWSGAEETIYTIPGRHSRLTGLYAILSGGKAVILDPAKKKLVEKPVPDLAEEQKQGRPQQVDVQEDITQAEPSSNGLQRQAALVALIAGAIIAAVILRRRGR